MSSYGDDGGSYEHFVPSYSVRVRDNPPHARRAMRLAAVPAEVPRLLSIIQAAGWPIWPLVACSILALA